MNRPLKQHRHAEAAVSPARQTEGEWMARGRVGGDTTATCAAACIKSWRGCSWLHHFRSHLHDFHNLRERNARALVGFLDGRLGRRFEIAVRLRGFRKVEAAHPADWLSFFGHFSAARFCPHPSTLENLRRHSWQVTLYNKDWHCHSSSFFPSQGF